MYSNGLISRRLQVSIMLMMVAAVLPPSSEPAKSQFRLLKTNGLMLRSLLIIVANFNKGEVEVCQKSLPAVERVCDCFSEFCFWRLKWLSFIEPDPKLIDFRFCNLLTYPMSLAGGNFRCGLLISKEAFDHSHWEFNCNRILNYFAFENERFHSVHDWSEEFGYAFDPAAHGGSIDRDVKRLENLFLPVERKVQPEFISCNFCEQSWSCGAFIDWLVGLLRSDDRSVAAFALVLEQDMVDVFEEQLIKLYLTRSVEADDFTRVSVARTRYCCIIETMFLVPGIDEVGAASTAGLRLFNYVESVFFSV